MKRGLLVLSASLVSIIAGSRAQASYQIIRWRVLPDRGSSHTVQAVLE